MAVPRGRCSNQRKNTRRAHHAKKPKSCVVCTNCGGWRLSHHMCPSCGYYKNQQVVKEQQ